MAITWIVAESAATDVITEDNCYRPYTKVINGKTEKEELRCDIAVKQVNAGVKSWNIVKLKCCRRVATSLKDFIGQIGSDIAKIRGNVLDDSDPFRPYKGSNTLWAIGLIRASEVDQNFNAQHAKDWLANTYPSVNISVKNSVSKAVTQGTRPLTFEPTHKGFVIAHWHEVQQSD